jgi:hypothetical protein
MQNMRRLFTIFLLVLLPLQLSWASVVVYCQHETGGQAKHFGHHDHQHQAGENQGTADTQLSGGVDNDCGTCHAGCATAIFGEIQISSPADVSASLDDYRRSPNTSPHYLPERPNWAPLA